MVSPMPRRLASLACLLCLGVAPLGCDDERGLDERRAIHAEDLPTVKDIVRDDLVRGMRGTRAVADRFARGFLVEDEARQAREIRMMLGRLRDPRYRDDSNADLMRTPVSFVAAVGLDGEVIARDTEPDPMAGYDLAEAAPVVRRALAGEAGYALSELPSLQEGDRASVTVLFAAPARHDGEVVGAVVSGLPLWRIGQQITNQLQLDNSEAKQRGHLFWALLLEGDEQHYHGGFPPDLRALVPDAARVEAGLSASPGGFTAEVQQYGRWYGYGVLPVPTIGEDVYVVVFRSEP